MSIQTTLSHGFASTETCFSLKKPVTGRTWFQIRRPNSTKKNTCLLHGEVKLKGEKTATTPFDIMVLTPLAKNSRANVGLPAYFRQLSEI